MLEVKLPLSLSGSEPTVKSPVPLKTKQVCVVLSEQQVCTWGFQRRGWLSSSTAPHTDRLRTRGTLCAGPAAPAGWQTEPETHQVTA